MFSCESTDGNRTEEWEGEVEVQCEVDACVEFSGGHGLLTKRKWTIFSVVVLRQMFENV